MTTQTDELLEMLNKRVGVHEGRQERLAAEQQWITGIAFYRGKQRVWFEGGRMYGPDVIGSLENENEVTYKVNLIRGGVDTDVAKVLGVDAQYQVRPVSDKARDRMNAELSNKLFDHARQVTDWEQHQQIATQWKALCGFAAIKCFWDPLKGEPDRFYWDDAVTKQVVPAAMLTPPVRVEKELGGLFEDRPPGDLAVSVCSPFGFHHDTASRDAGIRGCHWVAERHWVDVDRVAERFGMDPKDIPSMEPDTGAHNYEEALAFMSSGNGFSPLDFGRPEDKLAKRTLYIELWQRPDSKNKHGLRVCSAGQKILNERNLKNPYAADRSGWAHIPYVLDLWKTNPGSFWGSSLVEDALGPQYWLNQTRGSQISFTLAHGQPATYVGKDSGLDTDNMTSQVGRVYSINESSAVGVKTGPVPQMPAEVMQVAALMQGDLNKVMSQSQIDGGKMPGQLRSGSAVRTVNEERYAGLSIPAKQTVRTVRDVGRVLLAIGKLYYDEPRVMRYYGEDNEWVVREFMGADINNDLVVVGEPDIGDSIAGQKEEMMDLISAGGFNPQFDRQTRTLIAKTLKYKTADGLFTRQIQAEKNQEREIQEMISDTLKFGDQGYPAFPWQDHESEINALIAFMYTAEFDRLPPRTQALITDHWKKHADFQQAQQLQQLQMIEATKGAAGQPGQASQPRAK